MDFLCPPTLLSNRFKISKVIVVGDLSVGKTCLINRYQGTGAWLGKGTAGSVLTTWAELQATWCLFRFCKDTFDKNYKATIGVDFEMERFEVLGVPFSLQL